MCKLIVLEYKDQQILCLLDAYSVKYSECYAWKISIRVHKKLLVTITYGVKGSE